MQIKKVLVLFLIFSSLLLVSANETGNVLVKELLIDGFKFKLGKTISEIKKNLGKPQNIKIEGHVIVGEKIYEAGKFYTLTYDGIEVEVYEYHETKEYFITRISITKNKYSLKNNIKIGKTKDFVLETLGRDAGEESSSEISYTLDVEDDAEIKGRYKNSQYLKLIFKLNDDNVEEVVFLYNCEYTYGGDRIEVE